MFENGKWVPRLPPPPPSRGEVERMFLDLITERASREEVTAWAERWVIADDPGIEDEAAWDAVSTLAMADAPTTDRPYLFQRVDFEQWLADFRSAVNASDQ